MLILSVKLVTRDPHGDISKSLKYFKTKFADCDAWQLSAIGKKDYLSKDKIRACPAVNFLKELV